MSVPDFELQLDSPIAKAMQEFFRLLESRLELDRPLTVFLAGGMGVHLYTAKRVTTDIDAEFSGRVAVPNDLFVPVELPDGSTEDIYFDSNFSTALGLIHEDYQQDSVPVELGLKHIAVRALSPVDLAVSKISRLADPDKEDIHDLVYAELTSAAEIEFRAEEALSHFIGNTSSLRLNIRDALEIAKSAEHERAVAPKLSLTKPHLPPWQLHQSSLRGAGSHLPADILPWGPVVVSYVQKRAAAQCRVRLQLAGR